MDAIARTNKWSDYVFSYPKNESEATSGYENAVPHKAVLHTTTQANVDSGHRTAHSAGKPFELDETQLLSYSFSSSPNPASAAKFQRFATMAQLKGYMQTHAFHTRKRRAERAEHQVLIDEQPELAASKIEPYVSENSLSMKVKSNAGNNAVTMMVAVQNKDGSPEMKRICRQYLSLHQSPEPIIEPINSTQPTQPIPQQLTQPVVQPVVLPTFFQTPVVQKMHAFFQRRG